MAQDFEAIELNIAVARDNLAATLDEIADRVNPTNVVEKGKVAAQDALQKVEVQIALGIAAAVILGTLVIRLARRKYSAVVLAFRCQRLVRDLIINR